MQIKIVNKPLQRISKVPRMLADETSVVDSVGMVQFVENFEAEMRLGARITSPTTGSFKRLEVIAMFPLTICDAIFEILKPSKGSEL
jgi:hypothetical protein